MNNICFTSYTVLYIIPVFNPLIVLLTKDKTGITLALRCSLSINKLKLLTEKRFCYLKDFQWTCGLWAMRSCDAMLSVHYCVVLLVVLPIYFISFVSSYNLEPRIPIVKKGSKSSHFGYSVAQHQTVQEIQNLPKQIKSWWVLTKII